MAGREVYMGLETDLQTLSQSSPAILLRLGVRSSI
jgi:hypothetical protein